MYTSQGSLLGSEERVATYYDGTPSRLERDGGLIGAADSAAFLFSAWFRFDLAGVSRTIFCGESAAKFQVLTSATTMFIIGYDAAGTRIVDYRKSSLGLVLNTWYHVMATRNASGAYPQLWVNGVETSSYTTNLNGDLDFTLSDWCLGGTPNSAADPLKGSLGPLYFDNGFLDLRVEANRLKFRTTDGKPAEISSDGSSVTGIQPLVWFPDGGLSGKNRGRGGDFPSVVGTLSKAAAPLPWG